MQKSKQKRGSNMGRKPKQIEPEYDYEEELEEDLLEKDPEEEAKPAQKTKKKYAATSADDILTGDFDETDTSDLIKNHMKKSAEIDYENNDLGIPARLYAKLYGVKKKQTEEPANTNQSKKDKTKYEKRHVKYDRNVDISKEFITTCSNRDFITIDRKFGDALNFIAKGRVENQILLLCYQRVCLVNSVLMVDEHKKLVNPESINKVFRDAKAGLTTTSGWAKVIGTSRSNIIRAFQNLTDKRIFIAETLTNPNNIDSDIIKFKVNHDLILFVSNAFIAHYFGEKEADNLDIELSEEDMIAASNLIKFDEDSADSGISKSKIMAKAKIKSNSKSGKTSTSEASANTKSAAKKSPEKVKFYDDFDEDEDTNNSEFSSDFEDF